MANMNEDASIQESNMALDILKSDPPIDTVPVEELERELPTVHDGQVPLSELLSRVVQGIYAELTEMAET